MSVKITYFVHGTTVDNEAHISSGWSDADLSEKGIQQSEKLTEQTKYMNFDVVFTSDLKRAMHSAQITWGDKYQMIPDKRLRECNYGDYNSKPSSLVEPMQEKHISELMPNGESYEMIQERVSDFLNFLKQNYDGKHVAIVAHKGPQLAVEVITKGMTWEEAFAQDWRKTGAWQPGWEYEI